MAPLIIFCFTFGRYIEAQIFTLVFKKISEDFPPSAQTEAIQLVGIADMVVITIGSIVSSQLVDIYFPCSSH